MKSRHELSKNCSIHGRNCQISGPYNFWISVKSNIPDVWNSYFWTFFGLEIEWGREGGGGGRGWMWGCPPGTLSGYVSEIYPINILFVSKTSSRYLKTCLQDSRHLQDLLRDVFKTSSRWLGRQKLVTLKTRWRRLQDVLKTNKCLLKFCLYLLIDFLIN